MNIFISMRFQGEIIYGDSIWFKSTFNQYFPTLCSFAERIILDFNTSKDIVQEVFVALINSETDFESDDKLRAYLYVVTRNKCYHHLKSGSYQLSEQLDTMFPFSEDTFLENVVKEETYRILNSALSQLGPQRRKVIELGMQKLSNKEIAEEI